MADIRWRAQPFLMNPLRSAGVVFLLVFSWWFGYYLMGQGGLLVAVVATVSPLAPYLFPSTYRLSPEGVEVRTLFSSGVRPWDRFVGYTVYPDGVLLAYPRHNLRQRILKGVFLFFGEEDPRPILAYIEERLPAKGFFAPGAPRPS